MNGAPLLWTSDSSLCLVLNADWVCFCGILMQLCDTLTYLQMQEQLVFIVFGSVVLVSAWSPLVLSGQHLSTVGFKKKSASFSSNLPLTSFDEPLWWFLALPTPATCLSVCAWGYAASSLCFSGLKWDHVSPFLWWRSFLAPTFMVVCCLCVQCCSL